MMTPKRKIKQGKVLTKAYHDFKKGMNAHAFYKVHNHAIGEDLVQDIFIKTWSYLVRGGKIDLMKAFLYHVLNQLIIDEYRKHKTSSLDFLLEKGYQPSLDQTENLSDVFDGKAAFLLIKYLPAKYEKVIRLRYVQGLSIKEIAIVTGQSRNTVAVQAHRGLMKLRKLYHHTQ